MSGRTRTLAASVGGVLGSARTKRLKQLATRASDWFADRRAIAAPEHATGAGRALSADAVAIDPATIFQPDRAFIESYSRFDEADVEHFERVDENRVFYRDIPYSKYLDVWQFHPGRIGGYLTTTKLSPKLIRTAENLLDYMVELPNGGLALYYPATIQTSRFQANEPLYSGIAQGQLLAAYTRLTEGGATSPRGRSWRDIAARIATSMQFPVERGGVCVDDRLILEAPNYRSCPESILNGWLDALLHLYDYVALTHDSVLAEFYGRNVEALAALLPTFDDAEMRLSRYSNLCPYNFRVHLADGTPQPQVRLEYLSRQMPFRDRYVPDLWLGEDLIDCLYDNKIVHHGGSTLDLSASISGQYDLRIEIAADCRSLSFDPGMVTPASTVPGRSRQRRSVAPAAPYDDHSTVFFIDAQQHGLIPGCPTNFMKRGRENFYHVYHIAALYQLALTVNEPELRQLLVSCAENWLAWMDDPLHTARADRYVFCQPSDFARTIGHFRGIQHPYSFEELRAKALAGQSGSASATGERGSRRRQGDNPE